MQLHQLQPKTKSRRARQIGRGGRRGKTSGRGTKGQKARAGHKMRPEFRDIIKKIPKKRGYHFHSISPKPAIVNWSLLEKNFPAKTKITPTLLLEKRLVRRVKGRPPVVKILGVKK